MKKLNEKTKTALLSAAALILMWAIWLIAYFAEGNEYVIPSFSSAIKSLWQLLQTAFFWRAFANTLWRALAAFLLSFISAAVCTAIAALSQTARKIISPFITVLRTVPTMAIILIILLWSTPKSAPVIVGYLVTFPMIYAQMYSALCQTRNELDEVIKVYKIKPAERILKIYFPGVLPSVLSQSGAAFSLTLKIIVSAEVMANTYVSVGGMMQLAKSYLEIPELFALTIVTILAGAVAEIAMSQLSRLTDRWSKGGKK